MSRLLTIKADLQVTDLTASIVEGVKDFIVESQDDSALTHLTRYYGTKHVIQIQDRLKLLCSETIS